MELCGATKAALNRLTSGLGGDLYAPEYASTWSAQEWPSKAKDSPRSSETKNPPNYSSLSGGDRTHLPLADSRWIMSARAAVQEPITLSPQPRRHGRR